MFLRVFCMKLFQGIDIETEKEGDGIFLRLFIYKKI